MSTNPIFATRISAPFTVVSGGSLVTTALRSWKSIFVDIGNKGSEASIPSLIYANEIDESSTNNTGGLDDKIGVLLPLSAESVETTLGGLLLQYRHPRWSGY